MRRIISIGSLVAASVLAWFILGFGVVSGMERLYLLVPPVYFVIIIGMMPDGWAIFKKTLPTVFMYVGVLLLCCTAYNIFQAVLLLPPGYAIYWEGLSFREILIAAYFIATIRLLLELPLRFARRPLRWLFGRLLFVSTPDEYKTARVRYWLQRTLPEFILALVIFPFILGSMYVHRFKLPNAVSPLDLFGRVYEDVAFDTEDGLILRGWFIPASSGPSTRSLIICHGLGANRSNFLPYLVVGDELQANVLMFDFRGHGESEGHTVTFGLREERDVRAAAGYLRKQRHEQSQELIGLGISMGSSALISAAAQLSPPFHAVIVDSSFAVAVELTDQVLVRFPAVTRPIISSPGVIFASLSAGCWLPSVRPIDQIQDLRAPLLIIHAAGDELIPVDHARRLFQRAAEPKSLWIPDTGGHGSAMRAQSEYFERVKAVANGLALAGEKSLNDSQAK